MTGTGRQRGVDLIGPYASGGYWKAPIATDGSVDLDGLNPGGIEQMISGLISGDKYTLTFALSGNPDGPPITKSVDVSIGSVSDDNFTYTLTGANSLSNMLWETETVTFTAGASNILSFASQDADLVLRSGHRRRRNCRRRDSRTGHLGDDDPWPRGLGHGCLSQDPTAGLNKRLS